MIVPSVFRAVLATGILCPVLLLSCAGGDDEDQLSVQGTLERDGVLNTNIQNVDIDYASKNARGEWWPCDAHFTAGACVGQHHVNVYLADASATDFESLGGDACVVDGEAFGVYELLLEKSKEGQEISLGTHVVAFILVAADVDGDGIADLNDDPEVTAASRVVTGSIEIVSMGEADDPFEFVLQGTTAHGNDITVNVAAAMRSGSPPPLEAARTCVAADAIK